MKKIFSVISLVGIITINANAQLKIDNATFFISSGATVTVQGDVTSNVDIQGPGLLLLKGSAVQNVDMGGFTIPNLEVDNTSNINFINHAIIGNSLAFTNGKMLLNGFNVRLASGITSIAGVSSTRYVVTNGVGRLIKAGLGATAFTFPVGYSVTEFNPLTISNTGTADSIGVRCLQHVLDQGLTGSAVTQDFANSAWVVTEAVAGGSTLSMSGEWAASDELTNFNRLKSGIARHNTGTDWDLPAGQVLAAAGSGPYNRTRNNISFTSSGVFAVADLEKVNAARLSLKIFLQGAYNTGTGLMRDNLRTANQIPLTQPYNAALNARFTRVGVYDGSASVNETVPSNTVFDVTGTNDDIVDWVYVSLQDGTTPATKLQTRAALVQRDGDIVEYDAGTATYVPLRMPIDADANYHILISHRNHLAVRTPASQLLQDNIALVYNFTDGQAKAFQNGAITSNTAMRDLGSGVFGLWAGNANSNVNVRYAGLSNDPASILTYLGGVIGAVSSNVYSPNDVNMDGTVRYAGLNNDPGFMLSNALGGTIGAIISEHL